MNTTKSCGSDRNIRQRLYIIIFYYVRCVGFHYLLAFLSNLDTATSVCFIFLVQMNDKTGSRSPDFFSARFWFYILRSCLSNTGNYIRLTWYQNCYPYFYLPLNFQTRLVLARFWCTCLLRNWNKFLFTYFAKAPQTGPQTCWNHRLHV